MGRRREARAGAGREAFVVAVLTGLGAAGLLGLIGMIGQIFANRMMPLTLDGLTRAMRMLG